VLATILPPQKGQARKADLRDWIASVLSVEKDPAKRSRIIQLSRLLAPALTPMDPGH